jgi:glucokinase
MSAQKSKNIALVADIGGTNARLALVEPGGHDIISPIILPCADYPGLAEAAEAYLEKVKADTRPRLGAFDAAGPVIDGVVKLTNHPWRIETPAVRRALKLDRLEIINDFAALAYAVPHLTPDDRATLRAGAKGARGPIGLIGPGTGLGVAAVIPDPKGGWLHVASEGGHVTMTAADDRDDAILAHLRRRFDHVSAERVLSGQGLMNLYEAICSLDDMSAETLTPEQIAERAQAGDLVCKAVLDRFFAMLGTVSGNLALTVGAQGGIVIAGGIVPRYLKEIAGSDFEKRFLDKGRLKTYLDPIPVHVVTHPLPAFIGLAALLGEMVEAKDGALVG